METYIMEYGIWDKMCSLFDPDVIESSAFVDVQIAENFGLTVVERGSLIYHVTDKKKFMKFIIKYA